MGHLLATVNPEAAAEITNPTPLPPVGSSVVYCPRPGEVRAGKTRVPAFVIKADEENGLLDLVVVYDADDFLSKRRVPRRTADDHGWEPAPDSGLAAIEKLEAFKRELAEVLFGDGPKPLTNFTDDIGALGKHLMQLQDRVLALETKRGPGRPRNPVGDGED